MPSRASSNPHVVLSSDGVAPAFHASARVASPTQAAATEGATPAEALPSGSSDLDAMTLPPRSAVGWSPTSWRMAMSATPRG
jgi:hypothetical protein